MAKRRVFISYRRDDAAGFAHAVRDRLVEHLSKERVFMDVLGIEPGADFVAKLQSAVGQSDVLIALIGNRWAGADASGRRRIEDPQDWVRVEVATALRRGIRVIPVLLDGARMPNPDELPDDLKALARTNAVDVRGSRLNADAWDLTGATMQALGERWPPDEPGAKIYAAIAGLYAFFAGAVLLFLMIGSLFSPDLGTATIGGVLVILLAALVLLRLPIHPWVRSLSRQQALQLGAVTHLVGFGAMASGTGDLDAAIVILFGLVPAAAMYLGSFAMRRLVRS
jgi:hypothetical protein